MDEVECALVYGCHFLDGDVAVFVVEFVEGGVSHVYGAAVFMDALGVVVVDAEGVDGERAFHFAGKEELFGEVV